MPDPTRQSARVAAPERHDLRPVIERHERADQAFEIPPDPGGRRPERAPVDADAKGTD
jgi:hypothetical protein